MRRHHTKNKGDLGVLHAQVDLVEKGFGLLAPLTEHEAFDLVAYRGHEFYRIQVKYRAAVNGVIHIPFKTCWADRNGTHTVPMDKSVVDVVCIFCPDTRRCYYVDPTMFGRNASLRLSPTRNGQTRRVYQADEFTSFPPGPLAQLDRARPF
jgi:hypothetical protein